MAETSMGSQVAKKKASAKSETKRYGTLVRVTDEFADALRKVCSLEDVSVADFAESNLLPIVQNRYRDALAKEAKRMSSPRGSKVGEASITEGR